MTLKEILISGKLTVSEGGGGGGAGVSAWMDAPEPTDSKLHIWINVDVEDQKRIKLQISGTGDIDWGDGSTDSSVNLNAVHTYADFGVYEIVVGGSITIPNNNQIITCESSKGYYVQRRLIRRIYIPSTISDIGQYKLQNATLLEKATIKNTGEIKGYVFGDCGGLKEIIIDGPTSIATRAFGGARCACKVDVGSTVTFIGQSAFDNVKAYEWHFRPTTPPTLEAGNAFNATEGSAVFYVPAASVDAYKTAANWSSYASRIQAEP